MAAQVLKVHREIKAIQVRLGLKVRRALRVSLVLPVPRVTKALLVLLVLQALRASVSVRASTPTTLGKWLKPNKPILLECSSDRSRSGLCLYEAFENNLRLALSLP
jgi:hypothetical protein